jgi:3-oxoacyl-[acyl-carrier protein] reductase
MVLDIKRQNQSNSIVLRGEAAVGLLAAENIAIDSVSGADAQSIPVPKQGGKRPVLVTGGSGAIGGATALALAKMGHPVALGYRRGLEAAEMVASQVHDGGGIAFPLALDLGDAAAIRSAVKHAERELGPFVGLVHSATPPIDHSSVAELKWDVLERFMKVYIQSGLELSQLIYPAIKENGWGRILLMGTSAIMGAPPTGMSAYTIAKSALWGMTKALAVEWGAIGATANMVSPGLIVTPLTQSVSKRARLVEAQRNPRRRLAQENDVARLAAYLFSDAAEYINGVNLPLTGGLPICP